MVVIQLNPTQPNRDEYGRGRPTFVRAASFGDTHVNS